jgi:hypothetical protein
LYHGRAIAVTLLKEGKKAGTGEKPGEAMKSFGCGWARRKWRYCLVQTLGNYTTSKADDYL